MTRAFVIGLTVVALGTSAALQAQPARSADVQMKVAQQKADVEGDLKGAIEEYKKVVATAGVSRAIAAEALTRMAECYRKMGDGESQKIYERIVREFADQKEAAAAARSRLSAFQAAAATPGSTARQIAVERGDVFHATPSRDGRYLSFTDNATGDLAIRDLVTGVNRPLTNTGGWGSDEYTDNPVMSADSGQVAWIHYVHKENKIDLRVAAVPPAGLAVSRTVLRAEMNDGAYQISWLPDGQRLLVLRDRPDKTSQIGLVTISDGSYRSIKSLEWRKPNLLSLSPDGRFVAYDVPSGEAGSPLDIFVLATDGSGETVAVKNPAIDSHPLWSPDGSRLLFLSDRSGRADLWSVSMLDGRPTGQPAIVKRDVGPIRLVAMTNAGTLVYTEPSANRPNLFLADLTTTTKPAPFSEREASYNLGPSWSRDGDYLAYYSFRDPPDGNTFRGPGVVVIRSTKTGEERTTPLPSRAVSRFGAGPKWLGDHRSVLVEAADAQGSGAGFYRLSIDTGNAERLVALPAIITSYDVTPDGRSIVYAVPGSEKNQTLMRFDVESRRETALASGGIGAFQMSREIIALAVSPDGTQIGTTMMGGAFEVVPVAGGPRRELFRPAAREIGTGVMLQGLTWSRDQLSLLVVRADGFLWRIPLNGGAPEKIDIATPKSPSLHPDGKRLVFHFGNGANTSKVWALDQVVPALKPSR